MQSKFTRAVLRGVVFTDCQFLGCSFEDAKLTDCRFINCASEELNAKNANFEDCAFESFEDRSGVFVSAVLRNCRFERCRLDNTAFHRTEFDGVTLSETSLTNVIFANIRGSGLAFENATILRCALEESRFGNVRIEGGSAKSLTFKVFDAAQVRIHNCQLVEALTIRGSTWAATSIEECNAISELTIGQSRMKDLAITRNQMAYFRVEETEVSGASRIVDCRLEGLSLEKSRLVRTEMANCTLARYLVLDGATLDAVVLRGIAYAPGLEVSASGVQ